MGKNNKHEWMTDGRLAWLLVVAILVIDQVIKISVKTSMTLGESIRITDWFYITFVENNGMAWGMTFVNKLFLSVLRIVAVSAIGWFIWQTVRQKGRTRYVVFLSMVLAGAAGNIFDSLFYGMVFSASSPFYVAYWVPFGTGYADMLMGKVVDMLYFPIFHFADSCITVGVICLLLFCRKDLERMETTIQVAFHKEPKQNTDTKA